MIKTIHLLCGSLLFGSFTGFYVLTLIGLRQQGHSLLCISLKLANHFDWLIPVLFGLQFLSGSFLVPERHYTFSTHWIIAAYTLLAICFIFWLAIAWIRRQADFANQLARYRKSYHLLNWLNILFFILIIHDAVCKHTLFR
ncbi:MAG: DUF2269 domain-containing protein [Gammaproteobacteria bacterium]|nr:DUF2269 domain-containing protein [Gammaproteobacteria bacterium]